MLNHKLKLIIASLGARVHNLIRFLIGQKWGILLGVLATLICFRPINRVVEWWIVQQAIFNYGLPELPDGAKIEYAFHEDHFLFESYGFELDGPFPELEEWSRSALSTVQEVGTDFDCHTEDGKVVVRLFHSDK